jgi:hypothetical protein
MDLPFERGDITDLAGTTEGTNSKAERLSESELARTGTHARFGQITIVQWLEIRPAARSSSSAP